MRSAPGASARNLVGPLLRATYRIRVTGAHHLPVTGGVLVMATGEGVLDPALLATSLRRPIAVMVGRGAPPGPLGHALGRISVKDDEPGAALRQAVEELRNAGAVGCFPLGLPGERDPLADPLEFATGTAYLQVQSGVPVVPVAMFGSRGRRTADPPRPRSMIDLVVGPAIIPPPPADPLRRSEIVAVAELLRQTLADHGAEARARTAHGTGSGADGHNGAL